MYRAILLAIFSLNIFNAYSQLKVKVIDSQNLQELSGAAMVYKSIHGVLKGSASDGNGYLYFNSIDIQDSISVSHIGYTPIKITKDSLCQLRVIYLKPIDYLIEGITIKPKKYIGYEKFGITKKIGSNAFYLNFYESYTGVAFNNFDTSFSYRLDKIYLGLKLSKKCSHAIHLKVFGLNEKNMPIKDMLLLDFVVMPEQIISDPLVIDIYEKYIIIPPTGILISFQFIMFADCYKNIEQTSIKIIKNSGYATYGYSPKLNKWHSNISFSLNNYSEMPALGIKVKKFEK